ncbi:phytoene/squalene synthase family protein [Tropicimonas sp.]|uniref:phytoene/squalene synthase family protein n=1 Tax=Tropicimonas sp. TaxID=2067044 RepID=UPI003A83A0B8
MSVETCAAIVERGDPDRFLSTMAAPRRAREVLFPLYAFNVEVARVPWASKEPMICQMRLQWWRELLDEIATGRPVRAHEIAAPLAAVIRGRNLPVAPLDALVVARDWDIHADPFEDDAHLDRYLEDTAGGLMWTTAMALNVPAEWERAIRDAGWAAGLAAFLRAVPELAARGRRPLRDTRPDAVGALIRKGLIRLARAQESGIPRAAHPALRSAWRACATLRRAAADPSDVLAGRLGESDFARRAGLLRRALFGGW